MSERGRYVLSINEERANASCRRLTSEKKKERREANWDLMWALDR